MRRKSGKRERLSGNPVDFADVGLDGLEIFQDAFPAEAQKLRCEAGLLPAADARSHVSIEKTVSSEGTATDFLCLNLKKY